MFVKLLVTFVSLFLLIDEYFKVLDKIGKRKRKIILLLALVILSIVSIIDVVTEVNEGNALVEKANNIIIKSDTLITNTNTIISDLEKNIESVEESNKSIVAIDSVLKGVRDTVSKQVEIIKTTAIKSAELVRLEEKKFKADEARLDIFTNEIRLVNNVLDSSFVDISFDYRNIGERFAGNIKFSTILLLYNRVLKDFHIDSIGNAYFSGDLGKKSFGTLNRKLVWEKETIITGNYYLLFIIKCQYKDLISNKKLTYKNHFIAKELKILETKFGVIVDYEFAINLNKRLIEKGLDDFLIDLKSLK